MKIHSPTLVGSIEPVASGVYDIGTASVPFKEHGSL